MWQTFWRYRLVLSCILGTIALAAKLGVSIGLGA